MAFWHDVKAAAGKKLSLWEINSREEWNRDRFCGNIEKGDEKLSQYCEEKKSCVTIDEATFYAISTMEVFVAENGRLELRSDLSERREKKNLD